MTDGVTLFFTVSGGTTSEWIGPWATPAVDEVLGLLDLEEYSACWELGERIHCWPTIAGLCYARAAGGHTVLIHLRSVLQHLAGNWGASILLDIRIGRRLCHLMKVTMVMSNNCDDSRKSISSEISLWNIRFLLTPGPL